MLWQTWGRLLKGLFITGQGVSYRVGTPRNGVQGVFFQVIKGSSPLGEEGGGGRHSREGPLVKLAASTL